MKIILIAVIVMLFNVQAMAWEHEISVGYGGGKENQPRDYQNRATVINAKLYKFKKLDNTLIATIDASVSNLRSDTPDHNSIYSAAVAPALRAYFQNPDFHDIRPHLDVSSGPVYLSSHQLGDNQLGSQIALQTTLGAGVEFGKNHGFDLNFHFAHYCNGGIAPPNQGFNFPFIVSLGYQW